MAVAVTIREAGNRVHYAFTPGDNTTFHQVQIPSQVLLGQGFFVGMVIRTRTSAGADGSPFYIAFDQTAAPTDGYLVSGAGQQFDLAINQNVWVKTTVAGDQIDTLIYY